MWIFLGTWGTLKEVVSSDYERVLTIATTSNNAPMQDHEDDTVSSWVGNFAIRSSTFKPVLLLVAIHIFGS